MTAFLISTLSDSDSSDLNHPSRPCKSPGKPYFLDCRSVDCFGLFELWILDLTVWMNCICEEDKDYVYEEDLDIGYK